MPKRFDNALLVEIFGAGSVESSLDPDCPNFKLATLEPLPFEGSIFKFAASTPEAERHTADVLRKALQEEIIGDGAYVTDPRTGAIVFQEFSAKPISREPAREPELDFLKGFDLYELGSFDARLDHLLDNLKRGVKPQRCPCDCVACGRDDCHECQADEKCETCVTLNSTYPERKAAKSAGAQMRDLDKRTCVCGNSDPGKCDCGPKHPRLRASKSGNVETWEFSPDSATLCEAFRTADPAEALIKWRSFCER